MSGGGAADNIFHYFLLIRAPMVRRRRYDALPPLDFARADYFTFSADARCTRRRLHTRVLNGYHDHRRPPLTTSRPRYHAFRRASCRPELPIA